MNLDKQQTYSKNLVTKLSDLLMRAKLNWRKNLLKDTKSNSENYYQNIDELPLYNWIKCSEGNLTYVRRTNKGDEQNDAIAWEKIYDSYIAEFGLGEAYKKMLKAMKDQAIKELEYCITGDRFKLTEAEIESAKLQRMMVNAGNGMSIEQSLIHISKWIGQWLNSKTITTREYFNLLREYGKVNKG